MFPLNLSLEQGEGPGFLRPEDDHGRGNVFSIGSQFNSQLHRRHISLHQFVLKFENTREDKMAEQAYTVASDSENTGEEKSSSSPSLPEIAVGIDIGTSQCSIAVWNGSQVHILRNTRNQKLIKSFVTFKDEVPAGGVSNQLAHEQEMLTGAAVFNMKRLIGRVDTDPVVHASKNLPFLVQTLDIGVRPFIAALVNNAWRSTTPEEVLAIFLVELRLMAESQLKRAVRNVVLTVPVSFSRFQLTRIERACAENNA
ncbi:Heat shock 70 kDa protein 8 [Raphanus sativus]|nr:Heat shock 70 kDa protein 8 [Raphanus sativus]